MCSLLALMEGKWVIRGPKDPWCLKNNLSKQKKNVKGTEVLGRVGCEVDYDSNKDGYEGGLRTLM